MERKQRTFQGSINPKHIWPRVKCAGTLALAAAALGVGMFAGCHGESVNDYLNAGDAAMQKTELPQAEQN